MTTVNAQLLVEKNTELARYITDLHFKQHPELLERYDESEKVKCYEDVAYHLQFLKEAMIMDLPDMYANYILWESVMLKSRDIPETNLEHKLNAVQLAIHEIMGSDFATVTEQYINLARKKLIEKKEDDASYINDENPLKTEVTTYLEYLFEGKRDKAASLINALIQQGVAIKNIYQFIFQVSQYEVGRLWQCNKITVAHEHYCTAATQQIISGLYEHIFSAKRRGNVLVACSIFGELHEMGIRVVSDFFEMEGWDTYYLGANMPDDHLMQALKQYKADVLALSVTLPIHVSKAMTLINKIRAHTDFTDLKVMVGGYPFLTNPDLWQKVGADAFAQNADQAVSRANALANG